MTEQSIYLLVMFILIMIILLLLWRLFYIKQEDEIYRTKLNLGDEKIDHEIDNSDLKSVIDAANARNSSDNKPK